MNWVPSAHASSEAAHASGDRGLWLPGLIAVAAVGCGMVAAFHPAWDGPALAVLAVSALALVYHAQIRGATLLWFCLLLSPEFSLHSTFGLLVQWSQGLTLSNLLIPALALPVLAFAWLRGRRLFPSPWPASIVLFAGLLGWGALTWLPWLLQGDLNGAGFLSLVAHWGKLLLMVAIAAHLIAVSARGRRRVLGSFLACMGFNALVGIAQALRLFSVFSPLANLDNHVRVTGTFYDANMYGALVAFALVLAMASATAPETTPGARWLCIGLSLLLGINLVLAASRAGYLALLTALAGLLVLRCWKPLIWILLGCLVLALFFPARTMGRLRSTFTAGSLGAAPDAAALAREQSMRDSLYQYLRHPWLGLGFGRALYLGVPSRAGFDYSGAVALAPRNDRSFTGAQNMFLTVLAETGPVGLLLYLAWIFVLFRRVHRSVPATRLQRPGTQLDRVVAQAMLAGLAGLVAASCTVELFLNARVLAIVLVLAGGWGAVSTHLPELRRRTA